MKDTTNIMEEFELNIEEDDIIRLLESGTSEPSEQLLASLKEEIKAFRTYVRPEIWWKKIYIKKVEKNRVILENSVVFHGEFIAKKLKSCSYVVVLVSTIGSEIDDIIQKAFDGGNYLKGIIIDNIGTVSVEKINKIFWKRLADGVKGTNTGITGRLSPGEAVWPITEQEKIFQCFNDDELDVKLLESFLMVPFKSISGVYGFGEGIGIKSFEHICSECTMENCSYSLDKRVEVVVKVENKSFVIKTLKGQNLLKALVENNIFIQNPCNGKGTCGKCRVLITKGMESVSRKGSSSEADIYHLTEAEIKKGLRLACTCKIVGNMEITILSPEEKINVLTEGQQLNIHINPPVKKSFIKLPPPSIEDQRDDLERLRGSLGLYGLKFDIKTLAGLSEILRAEDFCVTACTYKNNLIALESGDTTEILYGIAVDIGTTTIACYLVNMINGETIDTISRVNKQRIYGADVISRINYAEENPKAVEILRNSIVSQINEMVKSLCLENNLSKDHLYNMTIAGNTVMAHMLLGISCKNIAAAPYVPVFTDGLDLKAKEIGINIGGIVSILPGVSSYVGSDITAGILSSGMFNSEKYSLLLDLGTNGEIALGNSKGIAACSTAAGPAFEAAGIKYGVGGIKGAISKVDFSEDKIYKTIGDELPLGICGSGVLDVVSELLKYGIIDETGRILDFDEIDNVPLGKRVVVIDGIKQFLLEEKGKNNNAIYFTQKDIRQVQLAKAAIKAGIMILMKEKGIGFNDIEKIYVAGGFGNFMNMESTINIGMIPKELEGKVSSIGNSAGSGAKACLLSQEQRELMTRIKKHTAYIELSDREDFQQYFMDSMGMDR